MIFSIFGYKFLLCNKYENGALLLEIMVMNVQSFATSTEV